MAPLPKPWPISLAGSATLALTPLVTFVAVALAAWWPDYVHAERSTPWGIRALLVVLGSAGQALAPRCSPGSRPGGCAWRLGAQHVFRADPLVELGVR
jgi:hypothetical protein